MLRSVRHILRHNVLNAARFGLLLLTLSSCYRAPRTLEPSLREPLHPKEAMHQTCVEIALPEDFSLSPFPPLTDQELQQDWAKELRLAYLFAADFDLYRAITAFKRALYLMPSYPTARRLEVEYDIALSYFLGKKYLDCVHQIEESGLIAVDQSFVAFHDLLLILYDSYKHECLEEKANHVFSLIERFDHNSSQKLTLLSIVERANLSELRSYADQAECYDYIHKTISNYCGEAKSVHKAEMLNALFPGAGYWYVGQKQTAVTAFFVNGLFIAAAAEFFIHGYTAAGVITLSLESGWYLGGIYGGGLAAKCYNERLYAVYAEKITSREKLYPAMMLNFTF